MKVGIVTIHFVPNYGAVLQSYALAMYLRGKGIDACTIDYRQPDLEKYFRFRWKMPPPVNHWLRLRRSAAFVNGELPLSRKSYRSVEEFLPDAATYDALITGSDQVWFTGPVQHFDRMYFLDFPCSGKRKISYAASAGGSTNFGAHEGRVRNALSDFDHIAVRDSHTAKLVAPFIGHEPVQVLDPVFLSDFSGLIKDKSPVNRPYVLVFGNFSGPNALALRSIIKTTGIPTVISLQYPCSEATQRVASPSPGEWLSYFRHAAFVVTSYFHGTVAAVKFKRPFLSLPTAGRRIKVMAMLEKLGLDTRCFLDLPTPEACEVRAKQPIDWTGPVADLDRQIAASKAYLESALK